MCEMIADLQFFPAISTCPLSASYKNSSRIPYWRMQIYFYKPFPWMRSFCHFWPILCPQSAASIPLNCRIFVVGCTEPEQAINIRNWWEQCWNGREFWKSGLIIYRVRTRIRVQTRPLKFSISKTQNGPASFANNDLKQISQNLVSDRNRTIVFHHLLLIFYSAGNAHLIPFIYITAMIEAVPSCSIVGFIM